MNSNKSPTDDSSRSEKPDLAPSRNDDSAHGKTPLLTRIVDLFLRPDLALALTFGSL